MTVGDLIDTLQNLNHTLDVCVSAEYDCGYGTAGGPVTDIDICIDTIILKSEEQ